MPSLLKVFSFFHIGDLLIPTPVNKSSVFLISPLSFLSIPVHAPSVSLMIVVPLALPDPIHPEHQRQVITLP